MRVTYSLNEAEIIQILKNHFSQYGVVYDWQTYSSDNKVQADIRVEQEGGL